MATSMQIAWKHRLLQTTLTHLCGSTPQRSCQIAAQTITPTKAKLMRVKRDIKIPKKKKRDSVSILQALSEVAGKDHTVPDYKPTYTDDRFVIPYNQKAQSFRFALTSGRVSAQYFIQHFPECFATKKSVPHILALEPKQGRAKVEGTSEEALQEKIQINLVADAMQMYEKIIDEGGSVAIETTEDLVDMIMFNFGQEQDKITTNPFNLQIASAWSHPEQIPGDFLQEFLELVRTEKTSRMYKSIILGFCKFEHMTTALDYYEEMKSKGFQYDRDIIHALLSPNPPWSNKMPLPASTARNLLKDMKTAGIAPTEETFRRLVSGPGSYCPDISFFTEIFNEMKALGMKPSLSMCQVFLKFSHEKSDFEQILNFVEKENIKATSENEMGFFVDAMLLSDSEFRSPEYALRVDTLFRALGESYYFETVDESRRYYRSFIVVFLKYETLENILEIYERVVPHKLQPINFPLHRLLEQMKIKEDFGHLSKLVRDVFMATKDLEKDSIQDIFETIDAVKGPQEVLQELSDVFEVITADFKRFQMRKSQTRTMPELKYFVIAFKINMKAGHFERAWAIFEIIENCAALKEAQCVELLHQCVQRDEENKAQRVETYMKNRL
ncbi:pentatricopeptide repeat domain-containing protein 3, mitochondrial-like [Mizuhopecten yessoensis]|uniref:pentatricopeptide repeat domain-containing protein 3, mitochondrial-like n=1 Tax=Mizuhopecten yessoensis TaxID=6573 RepID=UPI000B45F741|nr:pentatricopeptide repeat domain-containing protein 3, mitochondrial-like [Mizuhopecten yessoensis]